MAEPLDDERVIATWYGEKHHGRMMANGKLFDMFDPTIVAHRTLPLGTVLLLTNPSNGKAREVVVQDRGPFHPDPNVKLDLSYAGAEELGYVGRGKTTLVVTIIRLGKRAS